MVWGSAFPMRPITSTTARPSASIMIISTTVPLMAATYTSFAKNEQPEMAPEPSFASLKLDHERALETEQDKVRNISKNEDIDLFEKESTQVNKSKDSKNKKQANDLNQVKEEVIKIARYQLEHEDHENTEETNALLNNNDKGTGDSQKDEIFSVKFKPQSNAEAMFKYSKQQATKFLSSSLPQSMHLLTSEIPSIETHLKQYSQEIENTANGESEDANNENNHDDDSLGRQSFLSLTDLIRTLRPNDKQIPQIDSDYSNAMRVLGEKSSLVGSDDLRTLKEVA